MKIWNKIKANKKVILGMFIFLIITVVGIPIMINKLLYMPIATHSTIDSDWLSFWGSFLGGIIGGVGTLVGVLLTLNKMDEERKDDKRKERAKVIPLNSLIKAEKGFHDEFTSGEKRSVENDNYTIVSAKTNKVSYDSEGVYLPWGIISFCNVGLENALDIKIKWSKPKKDELDLKFQSCLKSNSSSTNNEDFNNYIQCITCSQDNNEKWIYMEDEMKNWIDKVVQCFEALKIQDPKKVWLNFGNLSITYKNVYGNTFDDVYNIKSKMYTGGAGLYHLNIFFEEIKKRND